MRQTLKMEHITTGNILRTLREGRNLAQVTVADAVGISRSHLTNIERGKDNPGREVLVALARYYDVSLDFLAAAQGSVGTAHAAAANEKEAMLLGAYRSLPAKEADSVLQMLLARIETRGS